MAKKFSLERQTTLLTRSIENASYFLILTALLISTVLTPSLKAAYLSGWTLLVLYICFIVVIYQRNKTDKKLGWLKK